MKDHLDGPKEPYAVKTEIPVIADNPEVLHGSDDERKTVSQA